MVEKYYYTDKKAIKSRWLLHLDLDFSQLVTYVKSDSLIRIAYVVGEEKLKRGDGNIEIGDY